MHALGWQRSLHLRDECRKAGTQAAGASLRNRDKSSTVLHEVESAFFKALRNDVSEAVDASTWADFGLCCRGVDSCLAVLSPVVSVFSFSIDQSICQCWLNARAQHHCCCLCFAAFIDEAALATDDLYVAALCSENVCCHVRFIRTCDIAVGILQLAKRAND